MMNPTLSSNQAKRIYDRMGRLQDSQALYEDRARRRLLQHASMDEASSVVEFGPGTGRFAAHLLSVHLPPTASYVGLELSTTMTRHARANLAPWASRATIQQTDGSPEIPSPDGAFDRFVSSYVFDLLSPENITTILAEAHRVLRPGGRLCLVSASPGQTRWQRAIMGTVSAVHRVNPSFIAGCQPIELRPFIDGSSWNMIYHGHEAFLGITSEILVAKRTANA